MNSNPQQPGQGFPNWQPEQPYDMSGQQGQTGYQPYPPPVQQPYYDPGQQPYYYEQSPDQPQYYAEGQPAPMQEQQAATEPPAQPSVKPPKKKLNKVQIIVMLAVLVFAGVYLFITFQPPKATSALIQAGTLGAHYTGDGVIVRNEVPFEAESVTSIEYTAAEGKYLERGKPVCNVFSTGYSSKELSTLQDYRDQIRDYQLKLVNEDKSYDAKMNRVTADVLTRAKEVRQIVSGRRGNLVNQEELLSAAISERQDYINDKYATDQRLSRLLDDEHAQQQRIDSWTKSYTNTSHSIVSYYTDGYEYTLNLETASTFTPAEVRRIANGAKATGNTSKTKSTIYRTIYDGEWMVLMLMNDTNWNPVVGQTYALQLERYANTVASAVVDSFTRSGGELLVRLRIYASVEPVLYMRTGVCTLSDTVPTLRVPSRAIYTQDEMKGVVVVQNGSGIFVPVSVVYTEGDYVYITAITAGYLQQGMTVLLF